MQVKILFWNIQGGGDDRKRSDVKVRKMREVIQEVQPHIVALAEIGNLFKMDSEFPGSTWETFFRKVKDWKDDPTPKHMAICVRKGQSLVCSGWKDLMSELQTSKKPIVLTRPVLSLFVNDVEIVLCHAPSDGGPPGETALANIAQHFCASARGSLGAYKAIAIGDFNAHFKEYTDLIKDVVQHNGSTLTFEFPIRRVHPGYEYTQVGGKVLDYAQTCGLEATALDYRAFVMKRIIALYHESGELEQPLVYKSVPKTHGTQDSDGMADDYGDGDEDDYKLIANNNNNNNNNNSNSKTTSQILTRRFSTQATDIMYSHVRTHDRSYDVVGKPRKDRKRWIIDHVPVIYQFEVNTNSTHPTTHGTPIPYMNGQIINPGASNNVSNVATNVTSSNAFASQVQDMPMKH